MRIVTVLFTLGCATQLRAQDDLVVRVRTVPESASLVGQPITLQMDVLGKETWANLPKLPNVEVPGTIVYVPQSQSVRLSESIGGDSYTGQRYEIWLYPQRKGRLQIPSLTLDVQLKAFGFGVKPQSRTAQSDPLTLDVAYPGDEGTLGVFCMTNFSTRQSWQPESSEFRIGDGVTRTITRSLDGAPGMLLMPLRPADIEGVRLYPKQPEVNDTINRGSLSGTRTESVTYVFEKEGKVEIPSERFQWWDVESQQLKTTELDGLTLQIAPGEIVGDESAESPAVVTQERRRRSLWTIIVLAVIATAIARYRKPLLAMLVKWRDKYRASEQAHFRRFLTATKTGDPVTVLSTLIQWCDAANTEDQAPRLDLFAQRFGDDRLMSEFTALESAVDSGSESWQPESLATHMRKAREAWRASCRETKTLQERALPPLYSR